MKCCGENAQINVPGAIIFKIVLNGTCKASCVVCLWVCLYVTWLGADDLRDPCSSAASDRHVQVNMLPHEGITEGLAMESCK